MKKYIIPRAFIGFLSGIALCDLLTVLISLMGQGNLMLVTEDFLDFCKNNLLLAFALQKLLVGVIGVAFAEASISFLLDRWSFGRQYLVFCLSTTLVWVPVSLLCWFPRNIWGVVSLVLSFGGTYLVNWFVQLAVTRRNIRIMNQKLTSQRREIP